MFGAADPPEVQVDFDIRNAVTARMRPYRRMEAAKRSVPVPSVNAY